MIKIGIDIGSTTVKVAAVGDTGEVLFTRYGRHNANARDVVVRMLGELQAACGPADACVRLTGSAPCRSSRKWWPPPRPYSNTIRSPFR